MRLPIDVDVFYAAQAEFVRDASRTRAMEQFLIDRSKVSDNIKDIAAGVRTRAGLLKISEQAVVKTMLEKYGYSESLELDSASRVFCVNWGLKPDEEVSED